MGYILNQFKMLKYFWQALKYIFFIIWHSLIWHSACSQVIQQLAPKWTARIIFSVRSGTLETNNQALLFNFGEDLSYFCDSWIQITWFDKKSMQSKFLPHIYLEYFVIFGASCHWFNTYTTEPSQSCMGLVIFVTYACKCQEVAAFTIESIPCKHSINSL